MFFSVFSKVLWEWPSISTSMPVVFAITSVEVHGELCSSMPKCPNATT